MTVNHRKLYDLLNQSWEEAYIHETNARSDNNDELIKMFEAVTSHILRAQCELIEARKKGLLIK